MILLLSLLSFEAGTQPNHIIEEMGRQVKFDYDHWMAENPFEHAFPHNPAAIPLLAFSELTLPSSELSSLPPSTSCAGFDANGNIVAIHTTKT